MDNRLIKRTELDKGGANFGQFSSPGEGCSGCGEKILMAVAGAIFFAFIGNILSCSSDTASLKDLIPQPAIENYIPTVR